MDMNRISLLIREPESQRTRLVKAPHVPFTLGDTPHADVRLHRTLSPVRVRIVPYKGGYRAHNLAGRQPGQLMPTLELRNGMKLTTGGVRIQFFDRQLEEVHGLELGQAPRRTLPLDRKRDVPQRSVTLPETYRVRGEETVPLDKVLTDEKNFVVLLPQDLEDILDSGKPAVDSGKPVGRAEIRSPTPEKATAETPRRAKHPGLETKHPPSEVLAPPSRVYQCRSVALPGDPARAVQGVSDPTEVAVKNSTLPFSSTSKAFSSTSKGKTSPFANRPTRLCRSTKLPGSPKPTRQAISDPRTVVVPGGSPAASRRGRERGHSDEVTRAGNAASAKRFRNVATARGGPESSSGTGMQSGGGGAPTVHGSLDRALAMARRLANHLRALSSRVVREAEVCKKDRKLAS